MRIKGIAVFSFTAELWASIFIHIAYRYVRLTRVFINARSLNPLPVRSRTRSSLVAASWEYRVFILPWPTSPIIGLGEKARLANAMGVLLER